MQLGLLKLQYPIQKSTLIQYRYFKLFSFLNGTYQGGRCPYRKKKDQLSLRRKLDRATQFANDFRNGSTDASQLVRLCVNVRVIRPEMKIFEAHRQKMKRQFSTKTQRKLIVKDVREVKNLRSL